MKKTLKSVNEIKSHVMRGFKVYWQSDAYIVIKDNIGQYLIHCTINDSYVGLTNKKGLFRDGEENDFFINEETFYGYPKEIHERAENIIKNEIIQNASSFIEHKKFFDMFSYSPYEIAENLFDHSTTAAKEYIENSVSEANLNEYLSLNGVESIESLDAEQILELAEQECFEGEAREPLEWWQVSEWLYNKLRHEIDSPQPVLEIEELGTYYWGRCTSGQTIILDGIIQTIVKKL